MSEMMYPHPRVDLYDAHRALYLLGQQQVELESFSQDRSAWLAGKGIPEPILGLFESLDYKGMVAGGLHPILVLTLERKMEFLSMMSGNGIGANTTAP